ncbi:MAG: RNA 2',3'-cyclic phosphodiesterase [Arenicella sp.]
MSNNNIRTFVGLPIPEPLLNHLSIMASSLAALDANRMSWVIEKNYHLTLLFLGEQSPQWLDDFAQALDEELYFEPQELSVSRILPFPESSPRLLAAIVDDTDSLVALHHDIKRIAASLGHQAEKHRFMPHITLARKFPRHGHQSIPPAVDKISGEARELVVYESQLHQDGARYFPLYGYEAVTYDGYDDNGYDVESYDIEAKAV